MTLGSIKGASKPKAGRNKPKKGLLMPPKATSSLIDVGKYWSHIKGLSKRYVLKQNLDTLSVKLKDDKESQRLLADIRSLCFDEKI